MDEFTAMEEAITEMQQQQQRMQSQIASVRQAMGMASMQQAMNQDGETVNKLIEGLEETSKAVQEAAGKDRVNNLDVRA